MAMPRSERFRPGSARSRFGALALRDRGADDESTRIRFASAVLPAYLRRARNVEELLPWLY
jgi:hypothetical protein